MKNLLTLFLLTIIALHSIGQTAYYDALALKKLNPEKLDAADGGKVIFQALISQRATEILKKYTSGTTYGEIQLALDSNPFITLPVIRAQSNTTFATLSTTFSSVGGVNVTNVADELAKFLVERTKQELSITFFQKFKEFLDSKEAEGFVLLFPNTKDALAAIDKEIYQYSSYLNTLREAFEKDLRSILDRLEPIIQKKVADPEKKEYLLLVLNIINQLRSGEHPAVILEGLADHPFSANLKPFGDGLKVFRIFSSSIKSKSPNRYWVSPDSLNLIAEETTFKIYLGLLYAKHGEEIINGKTIKEYLGQLYTASAGKYDLEKIKKIETYVKTVSAKGQIVNQSVREIKNKKESNEKIDSYFNLFNSTIQLISSVRMVKDLPITIMVGDSVFDAAFNKFISISENTSALYLDLNERKYNAAILDLSKMLKTALPEKDYTWNDELIKYGTFMANLAQAQNSTEVQAAIEAVALPVGSASIKRKTKKNIALNAYVGLAPGYEFNAKTNDTKFIFGVNTPIGITYSWGHFNENKKCNCYKENGSSSLFLSLVDIAAFSTFRFNDTKTEELPQVTLSNIFAPGFYYVYGLPKMPLSIGAGGQFGPQLRDLKTGVPSNNSGLNWSLKLFVAVDIPLLNFYTKSR